MQWKPGCAGNPFAGRDIAWDRAGGEFLDISRPPVFQSLDDCVSQGLNPVRNQPTQNARKCSFQGAALLCYRAKQEKSKKRMTNRPRIGTYAKSALAKREWLLVGREALFSRILELGTIGLHKAFLSVSKTSRNVGSSRSYGSSDRVAFPAATTTATPTSAPSHGSISASLWGPHKTLQPVPYLPSLHPLQCCQALEQPSGPSHSTAECRNH